MKRESRARQQWYTINDLVPHRLFPGGRTMLYEWIALGKFPKPQKLSKRRNYWPVEVVDQWVVQMKLNQG